MISSAHNSDQRLTGSGGTGVISGRSSLLRCFCAIFFVGLELGTTARLTGGLVIDCAAVGLTMGFAEGATTGFFGVAEPSGCGALNVVFDAVTSFRVIVTSRTASPVFPNRESGRPLRKN